MSMRRVIQVNEEVVVEKISRPKCKVSQYYYANAVDPSILSISEQTKVSLIHDKEWHTYTIRALRPGVTSVIFQLRNMIDTKVLEEEVQVFVVLEPGKVNPY
ncbi:hypothetical protein AKO1_012954 [Acrasis kona]|uniref:Uncharacterized protein n=1 Tax=Acrasis kona TaxID=1008807 RepID=A0AAW2YYQ8_9EUKA